MAPAQVNGVQRWLSLPSLLGVVVMVVLSGGPAAAMSATPLALRYTCSFPMIGNQSVMTTIVWKGADSHPAGQATAPVPVDVTATIGDFVTQPLRVVGASTVEGEADAAAVVVAPDGNTGVTTTLTVSRTAVPASGPMTFAARGTARSMVFNRPGDARITVGRLALRMNPRNTDGEPTILGVVDAPCELDPGQDGLLASFRILPAAESATAPAPKEPGTSTRVTGSAPAAGSGTPDPTASSDDTATSSSSAPAGSGLAPSDDSDHLSLLLVAVVVPAAAAAAGGCAWWFRRSRGVQPEVSHG